MRRFAIIALIGLTSSITGSSPTAGGLQCGQASAHEGPEEIAFCDGVTVSDTASTSRKYTLTSSVACQYTAAYGTTFPPTEAYVTAVGVCGHTDWTQRPKCPGAVGPIIKQEQGTFWIRSTANFWDPETDGCTLGESFDENIRSTHFEDCQGDVCCSQDHQVACTHTGGVFHECRCYTTPIIASLDDVSLELTSPQDGVLFDLQADGTAERTSWTVAQREDAFLALDRDGDGRITDGRELFGSATDQPRSEERNGFRALAVFDANGDDVIDERDNVYSSIRLWTDRNHDGQSEPDELQTLGAAGVVQIRLQYQRTWRKDSHGNIFRFLSHIKLIRDGRVVTRPVYDVLLLSAAAGS